MIDHAQTQTTAYATWRNRRVVVVGAGRSGIAAAELLLDCGASVIVTDARDESEIADAGRIQARGATLEAGGHPEQIWLDADVAVFSPGIRPDAEVGRQAEGAGVKIIAEIEVAAQFIAAPIIAVTGSNGKSTVTSMVGAILAAAGLDAPVCGNIGTALSAAVRDATLAARTPDAFVVEISSFQAQRIEDFRPHFAAILNIQPDHIDWHGSMNAYADAKLRLASNMTDDDALVFNPADEFLVDRLAGVDARLVPFGARPDSSGPAAWLDDGRIWWQPEGSRPLNIMATADLPVLGPHNHTNACAATALAGLFGIGGADIAAALASYRPLEHRMELCAEINGVRCINDSKATNVDAAIAALSGFAHGVWLILGGRDKNADFGQLSAVLDDRVDGVLLIGEASEVIAAALNPPVAVTPCETLNVAVDTALANAQAGDTVLLSPACTSFDQYPNFEARGLHFKALVSAHRATA